MARLILLVVLLLLSLLTVFRAPQFHLWLAAIVVSEYCWAFILLVLVILLSGTWLPGYRTAGTAIGCICLIFLASPLFRAGRLAGSLPESLAARFGKVAAPHRTPFSLARLVHHPETGRAPFTTFTYDPKSGLALDFYPAATPGRRPCVLVIHGGSWKSGDRAQLPELNSVLARNGFHVAAMDYRLAPAYKSPDVQKDVENALSWIKDQGDNLLIDTTKIVLLGRSAGAQIALLAAYRLQDPAVAGVVDFYGPADMVWGYSLPSNPLIMDSRKVMEDYLGGTFRQVPAAFADSSPVLAATRATVPTLIIHGGNDVLVSPIHSVKLERLLRQKRQLHYFLELPWATHGFDYTLDGPGGQLSTYATLYFLRAVTQKP